ncbi:glycosyltransferase [Hyalangium versicolor]|uniref:glycosyltransferase n=1 Tax=Hyalangium versicolor TaxID=2861190 RepID=UPI001CCB8C7F|nr:glycosyltransferase [Hyalangium versicolor]
MSASSPERSLAEPDLHVVVPVYNEAENFRPFYESLASKVRTPFDLLVVYDKDEDTTLPVARELAAKDARIQLVKNEGRGVLGALKTGMRRPRAGAVLVTMADLSDDHGCVDEMYELYRQGNAVVSASRYARGGAQRGGPLVKGLLSRTAGASLRVLAGVPTWDATNNFKLYSREFLGTVEIESQGGFELALELTVKAHLQGRRIAELPTVWTDRVAGKSNFKLMKWLPHYLRWYTLGVRGRLVPQSARR